jgi:hypothetical protein
MAASCASTSGIQSLKNSNADAITVSGCDTCVQLRIKNIGADNISSVTVENNKGETYFFAGVKAGKSSAYQQFRSMCGCGYNVKITYYKTEDNQLTLDNSCLNILPCNDFLKGKLTLEINTPKLPDTLSAQGQRIHTEVTLHKD